jgi:uncharacterized membrane protein
VGELLKTVHVLAAVVWIGGGLTTTVLMARLRGDRDPATLGPTLGHMSALGQRVFMPASLLLVLTGFGVVAEADWQFEFWIIIALVAWLASGLNGALFMGPQSAKLSEALAAPAPDVQAVDDRLKRVITVGSIEVAILMLVVVDMVVKPGL